MRYMLSRKKFITSYSAFLQLFSIVPNLWDSQIAINIKLSRKYTSENQGTRASAWSVCWV